MKTKLLFLAFFVAIFSMTAQDHAENWELQNLGLSAYPRAADAISIVNEDVVWVSVIDGSGAGGPNTTEFYRTIDGGTTWNGQSVVADSNSGIANISAVSATTAWASIFPAAGGATQGVFKTTDGGANWEEQTTAAYADGASFLNIVHFFNENDGICQGDPVDGYFEIYTTSDGGNQWTRVPQANIPDPIAADEYGTVGYFTTFEDAIWFTTTKGRIFKSLDKGLTWVVYATDQTTQIQIAFADVNRGYMANAGVFWTTNNGGESWNIAFPENVYTSDLCALPNTNILFSSGGSTNDGNGTSFSGDGGMSFNGICDGEAQHYNIEFINRSTGWSSAWNVEGEPGTGGIVKYIGPEVVSTSEFDSKEFVSYPNPVENTYFMTAKSNISNVSVVNMIGQEVYSAQPNVLSYSIDMSDFDHGTYMVNVTIDGVQGSVKVVK